eukprot:TRINITY_DN64831_c0_g1_i1.p1 TRINITY_DN64831_c0_g1~~TRINITY_DN64831_c0_g1_i1.p1  ORF type:complete len:564 (-),score=106.25 TRINITY_DN64831_c0_g1_i1:67-1758(-)
MKPDADSKPLETRSADELAKPFTMSSSEAVVGYGTLFGVLFGIIIVIAGKVHWGDEMPVCLVPSVVPFQDYTDAEVTEMDYPNPRCASLVEKGGRFDQDLGPMHYFWQLPEATRNLPASQTSAWVLYALHQVSVWGTIFVAQKEYNANGMFVEEGVNRANGPKYSKRLRRINVIALAFNLLFWLLHLLHTHVWYDALAPTVHEMSSQGSVILMLVIVLMMEGPRRGLFFGLPAMKWNLEAVDVAKRYHGYVFSWAVIYTFWYHPMEGYLGHVFGFFHVWIVMLQGSVMYTTAHLNRYWRMVCEAWVFLHGMVISMQTLTSNSWPMFTFGFGAIFALTQLPGLPVLQRMHFAVRVVPLVVFAIAYVVVYVSVEKWTKPHVVVFIPMAEYLGAISLNLVTYLILRLLGGIDSAAQTCAEDVKEVDASVAGDAKAEAEKTPTATEEATAATQRPVGFNRTTLGPEKRGQRVRLWTAVSLLMVLVVLACSVVAQELHHRGSGAGALVVYLPMCTLIPLTMLTMRAALPFPLDGANSLRGGGDGPDPEVERPPARVPSSGWTSCCRRC